MRDENLCSIKLAQSTPTGGIIKTWAECRDYAIKNYPKPEEE